MQCKTCPPLPLKLLPSPLPPMTHLPSMSCSPSSSSDTSTPPTSRCGRPNTVGGRLAWGEEVADDTWLLRALATCAALEGAAQQAT